MNATPMNDTTILIVDDDPTILTTMNKILSPTYKVRVANSGTRALDIMATNPHPDLILLDLLMPGMDGYSVLSQLKENPDTRDIPVIFVTVMESTVDEEKGLLLGAADYITKPFKPAILLARIKTHLLLKQAVDCLQERNLYVEGANRAKSEFLANMSHEFRTPMHGILSFARLGLKNLDTANKDKLFKYFDRINTSGERLLTLLNDLLDLSKLESGQMVLRLETSNLQQTLKSCLVEQEIGISEKNLKIKTSFNGDCSGNFDNTRIAQVITNLLSNAIKFSPNGETISIVIMADVLGDKPALCLSIEDEGAGIPEGELNNIFDKFMQSSRTQKYSGGTGLGLSISKEIIDLHHGNIWAEHSENGGSVFKFIIPA